MQQVVSGEPIWKTGPRCAPAVLVNLVKELFYWLLSQLCREDEEVSFYVIYVFISTLCCMFVVIWVLIFCPCTCQCGRAVTLLDKFLSCAQQHRVEEQHNGLLSTSAVIQKSQDPDP